MALKQIDAPTDLEFQRIHDATLSVLSKEGVAFLSDKAIEIFQKHGFRTDGQNVYFTDEQIKKALSTCPSSFKVHARNPKKDVVIGGDEPVCSPIYGAPYVVDFDDNVRRGTLEDYHALMKLSHMLPSQNFSGFILCDPSDVEPSEAHKYMLHASMTLSDRPFMGVPTKGKEGVEDMMQMAEIAFNKDRAYLIEHTFSLSLINSLTPLRYDGHAADALIALAENNQALLIAALVTGGATAPLTIGATVVMQNAEVLAGIVLSQLVRPGCPVVYGCASGFMDMCTVATSLGAPEFKKIMRIGVRLGHWYGLPCRGGGALTESCCVDAQAGYESMSGTLTAVELGVDFIQHSIGCLASYMISSYTKFVLDDGILMHALEQRKPVHLFDDEDGFALDMIYEVGKEGEFLTHMHTALHCRTTFFSDIAYTKGLDTWQFQGALSIKETCVKKGVDLLLNYRKPSIDKEIEEKLDSFLQKKI